MKMSYTYGTYEDEINPILLRIRLHHPLADIEAMPCPCCQARINIDFQPDGSGFTVDCMGKPPHFSVFQETADPPTWWRERVIEDHGPIMFYWRTCYFFQDDGTLEMHASGWDDGCTHWTGSISIKQDGPDYGLWRWIIAQGDRFDELISDRDLDTIRGQYLGTD